MQFKIVLHLNMGQKNVIKFQQTANIKIILQANNEVLYYSSIHCSSVDSSACPPSWAGVTSSFEHALKNPKKKTAIKITSNFLMILGLSIKKNLL